MTLHTGSVGRRLRDTPGFTIVALVSLALGIGLNVLVFAFTSPALFKALPYPAVDRLLDVSMAPPGRPEARGAITPALYALLRDRTGAAFDAVGVFDAGRTANLAGDAGGLAVRLAAHRISASGLAALGTAPLLGRLPTAADEQADAPATMVLGYDLWQTRFGGRADVVNQTVSVDGQPTVILGVMPEGFGLLDNSSDAWFTYAFAPAPGQETQHNLRGVGRLKPGASMADAQAAVKVALDEYAQQFPTRDRGWTVELTLWRDARFGGLRQPLLYALLGVGVVLLLVCVNVGVALGARWGAAARSVSAAPVTTGAVLRQSLVLALVAGALGTLAVAIGLPGLLELTPRVLPRIDEVAVAPAVLVFALGLSVLAALVMGLVPALLASRTAATPSGSSIGWGGRIGATLLVLLLTVQVVLAFVLLAGAGLGVRAYEDLHGRDVRLDPSGLLSVDVHLPRSPYVTPDVARVGSIEIAEYNPAGAAVYDRIRAALQSTPGIVQAAAVGNQPFSNAPFVQFWLDDAERTPDNQVSAQYLAVTENYFNTMGLRIVSGRDFSSVDRLDTPWVVLVNETLAKQHWPDGSALGHSVSLTFHPDDGEPMREIIGVVADTLPFRGASEVPPLIYVLHRQQAAQQRASLEGRRTVMSFIVRASGDPLALEETVRAAIGKVDMATPATAVKTVESYLNGGQVLLFQFAATLLGVIALVTVVTSAAGVYGLTALGVAQRRTVITRIIRVLVALVVGVAIGRDIWLRLSGVIESFLTNLTITPSDPMILIVAGTVLALTSLVALVLASIGTARAGR